MEGGWHRSDQLLEDELEEAMSVVSDWAEYGRRGQW